MRGSTTRRLAAASVLAAVAFPAAACDVLGGDAEPPRQVQTRPPGPLEQLTAEQLLPAVARALARARTAAFTVSVTSSGGDPAVADGGTLELEGVLRLDRAGFDLAATGSGAEDVEVVLLNRSLYVRGLSLGPQWVRLDRDDEGNPLSLVLRAADPRRLFKEMGTPQVTFAGEEEVDGVPTHHYTLALDPAAYVAALGLPEGFVRYLPASIPLDLWVDGDRRPRRFTQVVDSVAAPGSAPVTTRTEGTWSDFGQRVRITPPPADEVADSAPEM